MKKILLLLPFFLWTCGGGGGSPTKSENEDSMPLPTAQDIIIPVQFHIFHYRSDGLDSLSVNMIQNRFLDLNLNFKGLNPSINEIPKEPNPPELEDDPNVDYSFFDDVGHHNVQFVGVSGAVYPEDLKIGEDIIWHKVDDHFQAPSFAEYYLKTNFDTNGHINIVSSEFDVERAQAFRPNFVLLPYSSMNGSRDKINATSSSLLTHEIGHLFGYDHTFDFCEDRGWSDVPKQSSPNRVAYIYRFQSNNVNLQKYNGKYYAKDALNTCGETDQFMNFMDYSFFEARMFSKGQVVEGMQYIQNYNWKTVSLKLN